METLNVVATDILVPVMISIGLGILFAGIIGLASKDLGAGLAVAALTFLVGSIILVSFHGVNRAATFDNGEPGRLTTVIPEFIEEHYDVDFSDTQLSELSKFKKVTVDGVQYQLVEYNEDKFVLADVSRNIEYVEQLEEVK